MKKILFFTILSTTILICGCGEHLISPPVVWLIGDNPDTEVQYSYITYNDPGANADDDKDGVISYAVNGTVDMNSAGEYILTYCATNKDGYSDCKDRHVIVDGAQYISDNYLVADFSDTIPIGNYTDTITVDSLEYNSVFFGHFAGYANCYLHATTSSTTLTIPSQTVNCGSPAADRTFSGSGVYSKNFTSFTIYYTETTNSVTKNGHCIYTKN